MWSSTVLVLVGVMNAGVPTFPEELSEKYHNLRVIRIATSASGVTTVLSDGFEWE
jgi:hypothetical protein